MEKDYITSLFRLYEGLSRQGPGSKQSTLRALQPVRNHLPDHPLTLDIGCGAGSQTLVLAGALKGTITALDVHLPYLIQIGRSAKTTQLKSTVSCIQGDMQMISVAPETFDLIWSEGAVYIMGFENGLRQWQKFLKPGGYIVVSELSWLNNDPPEEARRFWLQSPWVRRFETGRCSGEDFASGVVRELELEVSPEVFLSEFLSWDRGPMPGAEELLDELSRKYVLGCLSNNNELHWTRLRDDRGFDQFFRYQFLSHEMGLIKPDLEIFSEVLRQDLRIAGRR